MERKTIAAESKIVVELFETLQGVTPDTDEDSTKPAFTEVEDQYGRFNIFARNVGTFADGHASLDYRLRNSEDAQEVTRRLLESLQWFLRRAILSSRPYGEEQRSSSLLFPVAGSADSSLGFSAGSYLTSENSAASTTDTEDTTDMTAETTAELQHLSGIEETIDRLYRLSSLIRTPSTASQNAKAASFQILDDDGDDGESNLEQYACQVVKHRCPHASEGLVSKMAKTIVMRRKRFLYRRHHQSKLSFSSSNVRPVVSTEQSHKASSVTRMPLGDKLLPANSSPIEQRTRIGKGPPSATTASMFPAGRFQPDAVFATKSVISTAIFAPDESADAVQVPPPPRIPLGKKEFECPYCCVMVPIKEARPSQWRQHFLKDLDPYVCPFPDCRDSNLMFSDVKRWLHHIEWDHARQWCCTANGHTKQIFESESAFEEHMRSCHSGAFAESHLPALKRRAATPGVPFTSCPFCTELPEPEDTDLAAQWDRLRNHVAGHLRSLALVSLPLEDREEYAKSQGAASRIANETAERVEGSLLDDLPPLSSVSDVAAAPSTTETTPWTEELQGDGAVNAVSWQEEWGFVGHLQYQGHDRDPTLQTFLRKLYLQSSPSISDMKGPILPCWYVPLGRNRDFFGREYPLDKAAEALVPNMAASAPSRTFNNPMTFAIYGPGGMGKTQVAVEFVHRHRSDFDVVLWAHADDASKLAQDFSAIALRLGLVAEGSVDAQDRVYTRELVKRWLVDPLKDPKNKDSEKATWLLVYDAVEETTVLNDFWPYDGPGSILITSRYPFAWTTSFPLAPYSVPEAASYLLKLTGRDADPKGHAELHNVSQKLGGLPLALTQMAGIIVRQDMTFANFAEAYNERESRQQMLQTAPTPTLGAPWYEHSVASVWALENLRHGLTLLNTCSMFDSDGISERLFTETFGKIELNGLPSTSIDYQQARNELLATSIISGEKASAKLYVHRLIQDVARMRLDALEFRQTFMACVHIVWHLWPFENFTFRHNVDRWSVCEELFPHVLRLQETAVQNQLFPSDDDWDGDFVFARLLTDAGWYHHERGRSAEASWFHNVAEDICQTWVERLNTSEHSTADSKHKLQRLNATLAEIIHNRGCIATETNQPALAFKHFKEFNAKMMAEFEATPSLFKCDMRLAISWNELGNAHMLNKHWQEGEHCFRRSMDTMRQLENFKRSNLSFALVNLGLAHWLQNRLPEALDALKQGLKDRQDAFGPDDRISFVTGRYLHALGNVLASMGDQELSLEYHRKALFHDKSTLGNAHHRTADLFVKLAEHSMRMKQDDNALALLDHALTAYSDRATEDRDIYTPEKARARFKRSRALRSMRKAVEADTELEEAAMLREQLVDTSQKRSFEELQDHDFDDLVAFWSR